MSRSRSAGFGSVRRRFATYGYATYNIICHMNKQIDQESNIHIAQ